MHGMVALLGFVNLPGYKATIRAILSQIFTSTKDVKFCVMRYLQVRDSPSDPPPEGAMAVIGRVKHERVPGTGSIA